MRVCQFRHFGTRPKAGGSPPPEATEESRRGRVGRQPGLARLDPAPGEGRAGLVLAPAGGQAAAERDPR